MKNSNKTHKQLRKLSNNGFDQLGAGAGAGEGADAGAGSGSGANNEIQNSNLKFKFFVETIAERKLTRPHSSELFFNSKFLINLYETFASFSTGTLLSDGTSVEDWNPFSQRPVLHKVRNKKRPHDLDHSFRKLESNVFHCLGISHELMHIYTWEPFFSGTWHPRSAAEFSLFSLLSEGLAVFYSDIVISPEIQAFFPDGESLFKRGYGSQPRFHPYRAFRALGIDRRQEILETYLLAFTGSPSKLDSLSRSHSARMLSAKIAGYYEPTIHHMLQYYTSLNRILPELWERYCNTGSGRLPTLYHPGQQFTLNSALEYFLDLPKQTFSQVRLQFPVHLKLVKLRRSMQTRAYFALQLKDILESGLYFPKISKKEHLLLTGALTDYLALLDEITSSLVTSALVTSATSTSALTRGKPNSIEKSLRESDYFYKKEILRRFAKYNLWVSSREFILPRESVTALDLNSLQKGQLDQSSLVRLVLFIIDKKKRSLILQNSGQNILTQQKLLKKLALLLQSAAHPSRRTLAKPTINLLTEILMEPSMREQWSVPLASIDPMLDKYRELLFAYK